MDGFDWKHPTDAMKGYKSPVDIYYSDILEPVKEATDNYIMSEIKMYVDVDKDELIKAMNYDRNQYATGYRNGYADAQKHGKWIPCTKTGMIASELVLAQGGKWYGFKCSECHFIYKGNALTESIYCQCCGARMSK